MLKQKTEVNNFNSLLYKAKFEVNTIFISADAN